LADVLGYDVPTATFRPESMVIASTAGELAQMIKSVLPDLETDALLARMNAAAAAVTQIEAVPLQSYFAGLRNAGLRLGMRPTMQRPRGGRIWIVRGSPGISILLQAMTAGTG
jgi:phosphoglycolate phosphatase